LAQAVFACWFQPPGSQSKTELVGLMAADLLCAREKGNHFFTAAMAIAHRVRRGAARPKLEDAEAPDRAPQTLETAPPLDCEGLVASANEVRGPTARDELRGVACGGVSIPSPPSPRVDEHSEPVVARMSTASTASTVASATSSSSETVAARRRAVRQRLLGPDGVFVGECKAGFCSSDCTRCSPRRRRVEAGLAEAQAAQPARA